MVSIGEITGAAQGAATAFKLARQLQDVVKDTDAALAAKELVGKIGDTQSQLIAAQADMFALQEENRRLKEELATAAAWKDRSTEYVLHDVGGHNHVRRYIGSDEASHDACKTCFERDKMIMPLNKSGNASLYTETVTPVYECTACGAKFEVDANLHA